MDPDEDNGCCWHRHENAHKQPIWYKPLCMNNEDKSTANVDCKDIGLTKTHVVKVKAPVKTQNKVQVKAPVRAPIKRHETSNAQSK